MAGGYNSVLGAVGFGCMPKGAGKYEIWTFAAMEKDALYGRIGLLNGGFQMWFVVIRLSAIRAHFLC